MKKLSLLFAILSATLLLSCVQKEKDYSITISESGVVQLPGQAAQATISINATGDWSATSSERWLSVSPASGSAGAATVTVSAEANDADAVRTATVEFTCGSSKAKVSVEQKEKSILELNKSEVILGEEGGSFTVAVISNADVSVQLPSNSWIRQVETKVTNTTNLKFEVDRNEDTEDRSTDIIISNGSQQAKVYVLQKRKGAIIMSSDKIEVSSDGGVVSFNVRANVDYNVVIERGASWLTKASTKAFSDSTITLNVAELTAKQSRSGKVYVKAETVTDSVTVFQAGFEASIILGEKTIVVPASSGTFKIDVTSNVDVAVDLNGCNWIAKSNTKASSTNSYTFSVSENPYYEKRSAAIFFTNTANGLKEALTVTQAEQVITSKVNTFDETKIVLSLATISDTHVKGDASTYSGARFKSSLEQLRDQSAKNDFNGIDGVLVVGDLTDNGTAAQAQGFKDVYESLFSPVDVPMVYTVGNHDAKWTSNMVTDAQAVRNTFGENYFLTDLEPSMGTEYEARHCKIKGYNILCVAPIYSSPVQYEEKVLTWLDEKLKAITEAEPEKFVIVLTHPMIYNTVYGSTLGPFWYTSQLTSILQKYPQVVTYGGHLHFPLNDPRSIWQGDFTSLGCASVSYMAFEGGQYYANKASATTLNDRNEVSQGLLTQFDAYGNMRLTRMDFSNKTTIDKPWEVSYPETSKSHLAKYNHTTLASANTTPSIESVNVELAQSNTEPIACTAKWSAAKDDEFAHHYEMTYSQPDGSATTVWLMSDFYLCPQKSQMRKSFEYPLGGYTKGNYTFSITAVDSWGAKSETKVVQFSVNGSTIDPSTLPEPYVDLDFTGGAITDAKGNVSVTNNGATVGKCYIQDDGEEYGIDAITTGGGKYATCQFKNYSSSETFTSFMNAGFTVEAYFLDKTGSDVAQGIVCATESGGWGLAERVSGVPYFVVGEGTSSNSYKSVDAKNAITKGKLVHVAGVYDPFGKLLSIYVDGVLQSSAEIIGSFHAGTGDTFNKFCLGADIKASGLDFPSANMTILDAKFYNMALNAAQVGLAHEKTVADYKAKRVVHKSANILAIGNSFSVDAMQYLYPMLKDAGCTDIYLGNLYIGGCSLQTHYNNLSTGAAAYTYYTNSANKWVSTGSYNAITALESRDWDYISLQQASGYSGVSDSYEPYLTELIKIIKAKCPNAKIMFHMTWAYQGNSTHTDFSKYNKDQMTMYNAIINAVKTNVLTKDDIRFVIPSGTAIQNLRGSYIGDNVTRDGYHMSYNLGRATVAMMWAKQITGCDLSWITSMPSDQSYSARQIAAIKDAVQKAYDRPFEVSEAADTNTENQSLEAVFKSYGYDITKYKQLTFTCTPNGYYNSTAANGSTPNTTASNSNQFAATNIMTKADLPVGSVIILKDGYQYRPEGWTSLTSKNAGSARPANVTAERVEVTTSWWGNWNYRGFNLAKAGNPALSASEMEELPSCIAFFVPKE